MIRPASPTASSDGLHAWGVLPIAFTASIAARKPVPMGRDRAVGQSFAQQKPVGEIVDSKCLGVMTPGQLTTHRACAIRCISGGIPPVLHVRQTNAKILHSRAAIL